jgi:hypothetical protein
MHPFEVGFGPVVRHESDPAGFDGLDRRVGKRLNLHIPLIGQVGFHDGAAAITARQFLPVFLDFFQQSERLHVGDDFRAGLEAIEAPVGNRRSIVDGRIIIENIVFRQRVPLAELIVIEIMRRCNLDAASRTFYGWKTFYVCWIEFFGFIWLFWNIKCR